MDGMHLVLIALVIGAGVIAALTLVLDMVERRRYEEALRGADAGVRPNGDGYRSPQREKVRVPR